MDITNNVARFLHSKHADAMQWSSSSIGGFFMTKAQLLKKVAYLESINDQLSTEVVYVDELMRLIGFSNGLVTVKATAAEIISKGYRYPEDVAEL